MFAWNASVMYNTIYSELFIQKCLNFDAMKKNAIYHVPYFLTVVILILYRFIGKCLSYHFEFLLTKVYFLIKINKLSQMFDKL